MDADKPLVRGTRITIARSSERFSKNGIATERIVFVRARVTDIATMTADGCALHPMVCWKTARRETNASKRRVAHRSRSGRVALDTEGFVWARGWGTPVERAILVARALSGETSSGLTERYPTQHYQMNVAISRVVAQTITKIP